MHSTNVRDRYDLIVLGGGLTGLAMAIAAAGAGLSVLVVEARPFGDPLSATFDGRVTAIARGSKLLLEGVGAWPDMADEAEPILEIVVGEAGSASGVRYDHAEVGHEPLGWIVENRHIRSGLMQRARGMPNVDLLAPARMEDWSAGAASAKLTLDNGKVIQASLIAVCEGRFSGTRQAAGIGVRQWAYAQTAMVCTLRHEQPHHGRAVERFFSDGPFAMLPMSGNRSSIVWALDDRLANSVKDLSDEAFAAEVQERFGWELGELALDGPRWSYPLVLVWAHRYSADRIVLVGDSARGIHPIAGQGWNLALRDVGSVAEILIDRMRLGLDPGDAAALEAYESWRRFDSLALVAITDGINRLFANDMTPLRMMRDAGLAAVDRTPLAKKFFMRHAMGMIGDLPRLMRGETL